MKKPFFLITLFISFMLSLSGCTIIKENKPGDAKIIAEKDFGISEILVVSVGSSTTEFMLETPRRYVIYVLGLNDNEEEVFVIVPALKSQEPCSVPWPFVKTFREIVEQLNSSSENVVLPEDKFEKVEFIDNPQLMKLYNNQIEISDLDVMLMITYMDYSIVQINNEVLIYSKDPNATNKKD
jgi:hypothetical protein